MEPRSLSAGPQGNRKVPPNGPKAESLLPGEWHRPKTAPPLTLSVCPSASSGCPSIRMESRARRGPRGGGATLFRVLLMERGALESRARSEGRVWGGWIQWPGGHDFLPDRVLGLLEFMAPPRLSAKRRTTHHGAGVELLAFSLELQLGSTTDAELQGFDETNVQAKTTASPR